jgi:preprotein translocase subunit SecE
MKKRTQSKAKKKTIQAQQNTAQQSTATFRFDGLKWIAVFLILLMSIAANYYYSDVSLAIRASVGILVVCLLLLITYYTQKGQIAFGFIKSARSELRKVVWPSRKETVKTTFLVIGIVILTAVVLWGFDSFFIWGVTHIMNVK